MEGGPKPTSSKLEVKMSASVAQEACSYTFPSRHTFPTTKKATNAYPTRSCRDTSQAMSRCPAPIQVIPKQRIVVYLEGLTRSIPTHFNSKHRWVSCASVLWLWTACFHQDVAYTLDPEAKSSVSGTGIRQLQSLDPFELRGCRWVSNVNWSVNYFVSVDQTTQRPRVACCSLLTQGPWMLLSRGAKPRLCQYPALREGC